MIKLRDLLPEREGYPKGKYIQVKDPKELKDLSNVIFDLIKTAYKDVKGGALKFKSPKDVTQSDITFWKVADVDSDPEIDVVYFGKDRKGGNKMTGLGHDGERSNISDLMSQAVKILKTSGYYAEVSGAPYVIFVKKNNVPVIEDEETVRKLLRGKDIEWHGEHPTGKFKGNGWYSRDIGGMKATKVLIGNPRV